MEVVKRKPGRPPKQPVIDYQPANVSPVVEAFSILPSKEYRGLFTVVKYTLQGGIILNAQEVCEANLKNIVLEKFREFGRKETMREDLQPTHASL